MKNDTKQTRNKPGQELLKWAAALSLGLISVQASAFEGGRLQATNPAAAEQELVAEMELATQGSCQLVELNQDKSATTPGLNNVVGPEGDRFFKIACQGQNFLIKYSASSSEDPSASLTLEQLKERMPAEQSARLPQPVAEFSFDEQGEGQGSYKVYTWIQAISLRAWVSSFGKSADGILEQSDLDLRESIFQQVGSLVQATARAALVKEGQQQAVSPSASRQQTLTGLNLWVTPEGEVIGYPDAITSVSEDELFNDFMPAHVQVLSSEAFQGSFTAPEISAKQSFKNFKSAMKASVRGFVKGYCAVPENLDPDHSEKQVLYCTEQNSKP